MLLCILKSSWRGLLLCGLVHTLIITELRSDELRFPDGNVLVGNYITTEANRIIFDSRLLGRIQVNSSDVVLVRSGAPVGMPEEPLVVVLPRETTPTPEIVEAPVVATEIPVGLESTVSTQPVVVEGRNDAQLIQEAESASFVYRILSYINPLKGWQSRISFGYAWEQTSVRSEEATALFEATRKGDGSDFKFDMRYDYGTQKKEEQPKVLTRDRFRTTLRYREDIFKAYFLQLESDYSWNDIAGIDHDFRQNAGVGWRVFRGKPLSAGIVPMATLRYRELKTHSEGWDFLFTLAQDLRYEFNDQITLIQSASASWNPDDFDRSSYQFTVRLENKLTDRIFVNLMYENIFDYEVGIGFSRRNQRTHFLIGYKF
jgi:hypothetical protein